MEEPDQWSNLDCSKEVEGLEENSKMGQDCREGQRLGFDE